MGNKVSNILRIETNAVPQVIFGKDQQAKPPVAPKDQQKKAPDPKSSSKTPVSKKK